jgi:hypothetical protein
VHVRERNRPDHTGQDDEHTRETHVPHHSFLCDRGQENDAG